MNTPAATATALTTGQAAARLAEFTVVDVRSPGEFAGGHLPGAHNVPLERLDEAAGTLAAAAARGPLLLVCASGEPVRQGLRAARGAGRRGGHARGGHQRVGGGRSSRRASGRGAYPVAHGPAGAPRGGGARRPPLPPASWPDASGGPRTGCPAR
ncbi:hypothetical protein SLI_0586 [Streptomyces lividans 1326]|uniref:Rhodanese domain-containing protein n=1 Tax=Streptomyces lividans 1326 TaxID=1200984 RepID=A0A7U9DN22_STRLI|nr:hypothetical protein SLI_0586 [Streptomyces lividans 1326]